MEKELEEYFDTWYENLNDDEFNIYCDKRIQKVLKKFLQAGANIGYRYGYAEGYENGVDDGF